MMKLCTLPVLLLMLTFLQSAFGFSKNSRIVGILTMPATDVPELEDPYHNFNYVAHSYIRWLTQAGAVPVIIPYDTDKEVFSYILDRAQGFLFTGGTAGFSDSKGVPSSYMKSVKYVVDYARARNDQGKKFVLWGTCLGFESMMIALSGLDFKLLVADFKDESRMHPVVKTEEFEKSRFWTQFDQSLINSVFGGENIYFSHNYGFFAQDVSQHPVLKDQVYILATSRSDQGVEFISIMEHKKYPFYGVQWHPEKHQFEKLAHYKFLNRNQQTVRLMREIAFKLLAEMEEGPSPDQIDQRIKPYVSYYQEPQIYGTENFMELYIYPNRKLNRCPTSEEQIHK